MRHRAEKTGKSPYQRYQKTEYKYQFKDCSHSNSVRQSVSTKDSQGNTVHWLGKVCTRCNVITDGPYL